MPYAIQYVLRARPGLWLTKHGTLQIYIILILWEIWNQISRGFVKSINPKYPESVSDHFWSMKNYIVTPVLIKWFYSYSGLHYQSVLHSNACKYLKAFKSFYSLKQKVRNIKKKIMNNVTVEVCIVAFLHSYSVCTCRHSRKQLCSPLHRKSFTKGQWSFPKSPFIIWNQYNVAPVKGTSY